MTDTSHKSTSDYSTPDFSSKARELSSPASEKDTTREPKKSRPLFGHRFGIIDIAVAALCTGCMVAMNLVSRNWIAWCLASVCILALLTPEIIQRGRMARQLTIGSIFMKFRKCGLNPVISGDMITWERDGKKNSMRLVNGCQLQVFREYPLQPEMNSKFESAASATMGEVFSAKIGVRKSGDGSDSSIFFSTEMLCSSMKDFDRILPATVEILDTAEDRQRENLKVLLEDEDKPARRIGFSMS